MSIRDDFKNYWDGNGLLSPQPGTWAPNQSASDNGVLFTSSYCVILKKNSQLNSQDVVDFDNKMVACIGPEGLLNRVPQTRQGGIEGPDDLLGVLNGCVELGNTTIPRKLLWGFIKHLGFLNNVDPGVMTEQSFLGRQPQLVGALVSAAFPSLWNPLHWIARLLAWPFYFVAAGSIAIANINEDPSNSNDRFLAWHLQNNTKKTSLMCRLASLIWMKRLKKDYPNGMKDACALYFKPQGLDQNPYSKWWVD
jgi:hypothetical protein